MTAPGGIPESRPSLPHPVILLVRAALWRIPLSGAVGLGVLALAGWVSQSHSPEEGTWTTIAGWGLTTLMALVGLAGGVLVGLLGSLAHVVQLVEQAIGRRLQPMTELSSGEGSFQIPAEELRDRLDEIVTRVITVTIGRLPLPAWLDRLVRNSLREALLTDFVGDLEPRDAGTVRFVDVRAWLLDKGLRLAISPIYVQFAWWQWLIVGLLGLLAGGMVLGDVLLR